MYYSGVLSYKPKYTFVSVLAYNIPAIKTQKKCGLSIEKRVSVIHLGSYKWLKTKI